jgi:hypothetical protein
VGAVVNRRLRFATAKQVFEAFPTASSDIEARPADVEPLAYVESLAQGTTPEDGISFCAYLLPRREAVWWACQCIRAIERPIGETDEKLLAVAEAWVKEPEETNRRAALAAGQNAAVKTPAVWVALAAAWSGGSMVDDPERPVPPPHYLTAQAVRAAVLTSLARVPIRSRKEQLAMSIDGAMKLLRSSGGQT